MLKITAAPLPRGACRGTIRRTITTAPRGAPRGVGEGIPFLGNCPPWAEPSCGGRIPRPPQPGARGGGGAAAPPPEPRGALPRPPAGAGPARPPRRGGPGRRPDRREQVTPPVRRERRCPGHGRRRGHAPATGDRTRHPHKRPVLWEPRESSGGQRPVVGWVSGRRAWCSATARRSCGSARWPRSRLNWPGWRRSRAWGRRRAPCALLAELGADMGVFASAKHLASWAGGCPGNRQSGGRRLSGKTTHRNVWLRGVLGEVAWAANCTGGPSFGTRFRRSARRRGKPKALVAVLHNVLTVVCHVLRDRVPDAEWGPRLRRRAGPAACRLPPRRAPARGVGPSLRRRRSLALRQ